MNAEPNRVAADSADSAASEEQLFPVLDGYWQGLQQGAVADLEQWLHSYPEGRDARPELRVLAALHNACRILGEDSRHEPTTGDRPAEAATVVVRPLLEPGKLLGEYRIDGLLGRGGMSEVYLAEHQMLAQKAAVKVLPARLANAPEAVKRFRREIKALGAVQTHPNIAAAFYAGEHQGHVYLVMEYVPGTDLKTHVLRSGRLDPPQACAYIRQAAVGLEYAHQSRIVHRDIKPSNLMRTPDGTIKIVDLGLARLTPPEAPTSESAQTDAGVVLGTVDYMAPEQAEDASQADARSDLYSLGCTFYYLLTGRPPFATGSTLQKLRAHALQAPEPVQQVRPDVPAEVAALVERLLAKRPEERYVSARALIEALDAVTHEWAVAGGYVVATGQSSKLAEVKIGERTSRVRELLTDVFGKIDQTLAQYALGYVRRILFLNVVLLLVLKPIQSLILRANGFSIGERTNYAGLTVLDALNVGLCDRLDDFSFWNCVAGCLAALLVSQSVLVSRRANDLAEDAFTKRSRGRRMLWTVVATSSYTTVYLVQISFDHGALTGTFFRTSDIPAFLALQRFEGVQMIGHMFLSCYVLAYAWLLPQSWSSFPVPSGMPEGIRWWLIGAGLLPTAACPPLFFAFKSLFADRELLPGFILDSSPLQSGNTILPLLVTKTILSILVWYGPYLCLSASIFQQRPSGLIPARRLIPEDNSAR